MRVKNSYLAGDAAVIIKKNFPKTRCYVLLWNLYWLQCNQLYYPEETTGFHLYENNRDAFQVYREFHPRNIVGVAERRNLFKATRKPPFQKCEEIQPGTQRRCWDCDELTKFRTDTVILTFEGKDSVIGTWEKNCLELGLQMNKPILVAVITDRDKQSWVIE